MKCPEGEKKGPGIFFVGFGRLDTGHRIGHFGYVFKLVAIANYTLMMQALGTTESLTSYSIGDDFSFTDKCSNLSITGDARVVARTASPATG